MMNKSARSNLNVCGQAAPGQSTPMGSACATLCNVDICKDAVIRQACANRGHAYVHHVTCVFGFFSHRHFEKEACGIASAVISEM